VVAMRVKPYWPGLSAGLVLCLLGASAALAQPPAGAMLGAQAKKPSIGQSISQGFKNGVGKVAGALSPKKSAKPAEDPLSLSTRSKPSAKLFVALARLQEQENRLSAAAERYEQALKKEPDYPAALLGYARLKERLGHPDEAEKLYQRAAQAHPRDPSVANNMGLFYAKQKQQAKAVSALNQAVRLKPREAKYRHNLALVLVQTGRNEEAFGHLRAVHTEAVAHYNLGYLLRTKGDARAATFHFGQALRADSSMVAAKHWLTQLDQDSRQARRGPAAAAPPRATAPPPANHEAAGPPRVRLDVGRPPGTGQSPAPPPYGSQRPGDPDPVLRFIPPPPRRAAPSPGPARPDLSGPRLDSPAVPRAPVPSHRVAAGPSARNIAPLPNGPRAPVPGGRYQPLLPGGPPLPPDSRMPEPVRRLPRVH